MTSPSPTYNDPDPHLPKRSLLVHALFVALVLLALAAVSQLGAATSTWNGNTSTGNGTSWSPAGNWVGNVAPASGNDLLFNNRTGGGTISSPMSVSGTITVGNITFDNNNSALPSVLQINTNGSGSTNQTLTINTGITLSNSTTSVLFTASNNGTLSIALGAAAVFDIQNAASTLTLSPKISGGFGFSKNGAGTLALSTGNTFTGKTVINNGLISTSGESAFGANPGSFTPDQITLNGGGILSSGSMNFSSNRGLTLGASGGTFDTTGGTITLTNVVTGTGALTKTGAGTLILAGSHTYAGNTVITNGTLQLTNATGIPSGSGKGNVVLDGGASAAGILDLAGLDVGINGLTGSTGTVLGQIINSTASTSKTLTVGNNNATSTFAGTLKNNNGTGGTVALTKTGTGSLVLTGTNTYSGTTTISTGTLQVGNNNTGSTGSSSAVGVNGSTAVLAGTGTVNGSTTVTLGQIRPGDADGSGIGTLNTGTVTLAGSATAATRLILQTAATSASSINDAANIRSAIASNTLSTYLTNQASAYELEVGAHDKLNIVGSLNLNANSGITVDNTLGYNFVFGDVFNLLNWTTVNLDGDGAGGFASFDVNNDLTLPAVNTGLAFDRSLFVTNGIVVVVPEPSRLMLVLVGISAMALRRRNPHCLRMSAFTTSSASGSGSGCQP